MNLLPYFFQEDKKMIRYRDGKIVSTKGERYTQVTKAESEEMKKSYVNNSWQLLKFFARLRAWHKPVAYHALFLKLFAMIILYYGDFHASLHMGMQDSFYCQTLEQTNKQTMILIMASIRWH